MDIKKGELPPIQASEFPKAAPMIIERLFGFSRRRNDSDVVEIKIGQIRAIVDHDAALQHDLYATTVLLGQVHQNVFMTIRELGVLEDGEAFAGLEESSIGQRKLPVDEGSGFLGFGFGGLRGVLVQTFHDDSPLMNELMNEQMREPFPSIKPKAMLLRQLR